MTLTYQSMTQTKEGILNTALFGMKDAVRDVGKAFNDKPLLKGIDALSPAKFSEVMTVYYDEATHQLAVTTSKAITFGGTDGVTRTSGTLEGLSDISDLVRAGSSLGGTVSVPVLVKAGEIGNQFVVPLIPESAPYYDGIAKAHGWQFQSALGWDNVLATGNGYASGSMGTSVTMSDGPATVAFSVVFGTQTARSDMDWYVTQFPNITKEQKEFLYAAADSIDSNPNSKIPPNVIYVEPKHDPVPEPTPTLVVVDPNSVFPQPSFPKVTFPDAGFPKAEFPSAVMPGTGFPAPEFAAVPSQTLAQQMGQPQLAYAVEFTDRSGLPDGGMTVKTVRGPYVEYDSTHPDGATTHTLAEGDTTLLSEMRRADGSTSTVVRFAGKVESIDTGPGGEVVARSLALDTPNGPETIYQEGRNGDASFVRIWEDQGGTARPTHTEETHATPTGAISQTVVDNRYDASGTLVATRSVTTSTDGSGTRVTTDHVFGKVVTESYVTGAGAGAEASSVSVSDLDGHLLSRVAVSGSGQVLSETAYEGGVPSKSYTFDPATGIQTYASFSGGQVTETASQARDGHVSVTHYVGGVPVNSMPGAPGDLLSLDGGWSPGDGQGSFPGAVATPTTGDTYSDGAAHGFPSGGMPGIIPVGTGGGSVASGQPDAGALSTLVTDVPGHDGSGPLHIVTTFRAPSEGGAPRTVSTVTTDASGKLVHSDSFSDAGTLAHSYDLNLLTKTVTETDFDASGRATHMVLTMADGSRQVTDYQGGTMTASHSYDPSGALTGGVFENGHWASSPQSSTGLVEGANVANAGMGSLTGMPAGFPIGTQPAGGNLGGSMPASGTMPGGAGTMPVTGYLPPGGDTLTFRDVTDASTGSSAHLTFKGGLPYAMDLSYTNGDAFHFHVGATDMGGGMTSLGVTDALGPQDLASLFRHEGVRLDALDGMVDGTISVGGGTYKVAAAAPDLLGAVEARVQANLSMYPAGADPSALATAHDAQAHLFLDQAAAMVRQLAMGSFYQGDFHM